MPLKPRPPVVVIMGHIDHGKSTLLDYIRKSNTTDKEAGGITQHLGAYEVAFIPDEDGNGKSGSITFLDTPGHEAFVGIRNRGAKVADIAILVVSAEDGVKPQTKEAFEEIRSAGIPYIVAITKIDKPNANIEKVKGSLAENEIYLEGYGGDVSWVPISAVTGEGIKELLDMITLVADMAELKSDESLAPKGVIIEANLDHKKGISATVIIKEGVLKSGMFVVAGQALSPVRIFENCYGLSIKTAKPGRPAIIIGFDRMPEVGTEFFAFDSKKDAEKLQNEAIVKARENKIISDKSTKKINDQKTENPLNVTIPIVIKADTLGSLEGIKHELSKIVSESVNLRIIFEGLGNISEADVKIAQTNKDTFILGFNVPIDSKAKGMVERSGVKVMTWDIIYKMMEFLNQLVIDRKPKVKVEEDLGTLKIMQVFSREKDKEVIGGKVQKGVIRLGTEFRIIRREAEIGIGKIRELQQAKKRVNEVAEGFECGLLVDSKIEIVIGDKIQCFTITEK